MTPAAVSHPFERAGLGVAPFRVVGVCEKRGPIRTVLASGVVSEVGGPGQPMGTCSYCSQGIAICYAVRSADGKTFDVGSECVNRTNTPIEPKVVRELNAKARDRRNAVADERVARTRELLAREDVRAALAAQAAGGDGWNASRPMLERVEWLLAHAGRSGKVRACRLVEQVVAELPAVKS